MFLVDVQEPQKPDDALGYLKKSVGGSLEDKRTIEALHKENEDLKKRVRGNDQVGGSLEDKQCCGSRSARIRI